MCGPVALCCCVRHLLTVGVDWSSSLSEPNTSQGSAAIDSTRCVWVGWLMSAAVRCVSVHFFANCCKKSINLRSCLRAPRSPVFVRPKDRRGERRCWLERVQHRRSNNGVSWI